MSSRMVYRKASGARGKLGTAELMNQDEARSTKKAMGKAKKIARVGKPTRHSVPPVPRWSAHRRMEAWNPDLCFEGGIILA